MEETQKVQEEKVVKKTNNSVIVLLALIALILGAGLFFLLKYGRQSPTNTQIENLETQTNQTQDLIEPLENDATEPSIIVEEPEPIEPEIALLPDLEIHEYSFSEDPEQGQEFTVHIEIKNTGDADATNVDWQWWPTASTPACEGQIDDLPKGIKKTVECQYTYNGWSTYATKVVVDPDNTIEESNENNNEQTLSVVPIHDTPKPDLKISQYEFDPTPEKGVPFDVKITIYNQGNAPAGEFWWEWWPTAYDYACREKIAGLVARGGRVVTCTYTYNGWSNYATKAVADADNDIAETDESNNEHVQYVIPIH